LKSLLRLLDGYSPWDSLEILLSLDLADHEQRPLALLRAGDRRRAVHAVLAARARRPDLVRRVSQEESDILALLDDDLDVQIGVSPAHRSPDPPAGAAGR
jgi:hypothetical protein